MTRTLLIVESPAKCKKIEQYLGENYKCIASFGHIRQLNGLKDIDINNNFKPKFTTIKEKSKQISKIKSEIAKSDKVVLATDDDREGEAIAWHICMLFKLPIKTTPRITFHEITKTALQAAIKSPKMLNMSIVEAQLARQVLDILVGYKISPILWEKIAKKTKGSLSAGRCQTPALRLIYDNQMEINSSPGNKVYKTTGYFTSKCLPFQLQTDFTEKNDIESFLENSVSHSHIYNCSNPKKISKKTPTPFTTSSLQQAANNELRYSPKETMSLCQKLYESGHITYMRTDSTKYSPEFLQLCSEFIKNQYGQKYISVELNKLKVGGKKSDGAQEAHEAIRVTKLQLTDPSNVVGHELKLYTLIRRNTIESCMVPAIFETIMATITSPCEKGSLYKYSSEHLIFDGWKAVSNNISEETEKEYLLLTTIKKNSILEYKKITSKITLKQQKMHFTEAALVQKLEKCGIGRPSTFASLISKIQERNYVKKQNVPGKEINCVDYELVGEELLEIIDKRTVGAERNKLVLQPIGELVIQYLLEHFVELFEYDYTASMEKTLDLVACGKSKWFHTCRDCLSCIHSLIDKAGVIEKTGIQIDKNHTYIIGKFGPVIKAEENGKTTFKPVKSDICLTKLRNNEYCLDDIIKTKSNSVLLGQHKNENVYVKTGKYGLYVECGSIKSSLQIKKSIDTIQLCDVIGVLSKSSSNIIRKLNEDLSIRSGKYGDYIFYKKPQWKKPRFLKLNDFIKEHGANSYKTCKLDIILDWLKENYSL